MMILVWFVLLLFQAASQEPVSGFSITPRSTSTNLILLGGGPPSGAASRAAATRRHLKQAAQGAPPPPQPFLVGAPPLFPPSSSSRRRRRRQQATRTTRQHLARQDDGENGESDDLNPTQHEQYEQNDGRQPFEVMKSTIFSCPRRSLYFSMAMVAAGAVLGPFLDSYHSAFGVLQYNAPISFTLWGGSISSSSTAVEHPAPALTTAVWVPALFGLAGFIIGWLYILLDAVSNATTTTTTTTPFAPSGLANNKTSRHHHPSPPKILLGISLFTFQYWLSGALYQSGGGVDRTTILNIMSLVAASGFYLLDRTMTGFVASTATALGGPCIEAVLITASSRTQTTPGFSSSFFAANGYHYNDLGETGFFPLWIVPVYFLGGPAVGNLARGIWNGLALAPSAATTLAASTVPKDDATSTIPNCSSCNDTRCVPCPNCNGQGQYLAMGNIMTKCTSCRGRGFVICRSCFAQYNEDPEDINAIRDLMSRRPD